MKSTTDTLSKSVVVAAATLVLSVSVWPASDDRANARINTAYSAAVAICRGGTTAGAQDEWDVTGAAAGGLLIRRPGVKADIDFRISRKDWEGISPPTEPADADYTRCTESAARLFLEQFAISNGQRMRLIKSEIGELEAERLRLQIVLRNEQNAKTLADSAAQMGKITQAERSRTWIGNSTASMAQLKQVDARLTELRRELEELE